MVSFSVIIFQRVKLSTRSISHLCWCNWRTFWRKNAAERSPRGHRALATQKELAYLGLHCLDHPPYSPDLAPSDYHLFPGLKKQLKVRHFSSNAEVTVAAKTWLGGQLSEFFLKGLHKLEQRAKKCIELREEYVK
jgi:histone-lysine N-methyltransferase SETMAR